MKDSPTTGNARDGGPGPDATILGGPLARQTFDILLKPVSHPELGEIRIEDDLFAIGRTEPPFASYPPEVIADLSRRHARIFYEVGSAYLADLDSKNGTTVNGKDVRQQITRLRNGDEIRFGRSLAYRVQLAERKEARAGAERLASLTLEPEHPGTDLLPIVINRFPFLVGKADAAFARYKTRYPEEVTYLSRRHAHIFLKGGFPWLEDLGSVNGTFVDGKRLEEHAVPLGDGSVVAFGGHHFVYRASLQKETAQAAEATLTMLAKTAQPEAADIGRPAAQERQDQQEGRQGQPAPPQLTVSSDKTTFVAAADSFLDIFCVDQAAPEENADAKADAAPAPDAARKSGKRAARGKSAHLASELARAFRGDPGPGGRGGLRRAGVLVALLAAGAVGLYLSQAPQREVRDLLAQGEYEQAARQAGEGLARNPEQAELRVLGAEALLKAGLPAWMARIRENDFAGAEARLAGMRELSRHNADAQPLLAELEWIGALESFVAGRGGPDAPVRIYTDETRIRALLQHWDDNTQEHQRAVARISAYAPEFGPVYAQALSHLRKLQNDDSVYLAAIDRLNANIAAELENGRPASLAPLLEETGQRYPRLAGLERLQADLALYREIDQAARQRKLGPLAEVLERANFSTPPFQAAFGKLAASGAIPAPEVVERYRGVAAAWRKGESGQALSGLQSLEAGPWQDAVSSDLAHKEQVARQFAGLQKARGGKDYGERLLDFFGALDPDQDAYFIAATETDVGAIKERALKRGQDQAQRAQDLWRRYRENGAIEGGQRLEAGISGKFRAQARLLAQAHEEAQGALRIHRQLKADYPEPWRRLNEEIDAELDTQRRSLQELQRVLEPGLLKAKLALLGGSQNGEGKPAKAAE
mgnify:FL=1